jgi:hypothetical protein
MTVQCKYCGSRISLTEQESTQIAADLDRRYTWGEQAELDFKGVCADCWPQEERHLNEARRGRRVRYIAATVV